MHIYSDAYLTPTWFKPNFTWFSMVFFSDKWIDMGFQLFNKLLQLPLNGNHPNML